MIILLLLILARAPAPGRIGIFSVAYIAARPHGLIVVLRRRAPRLIKRRWHAPSWPTPLSPGPCQRARRPRGATSVATTFVAVSSYRSLSALAVRQRRLHLPYVAVVVMSENEKKKDVF